MELMQKGVVYVNDILENSGKLGIYGNITNRNKLCGIPRSDTIYTKRFIKSS